MKTIIKKLPKSEVEIEGELEAEKFETFFKPALAKIGETLKLDGFRQGKIPESVVLSNVPESSILEEMAQMALNEYYPKILEGELPAREATASQGKIDAIGRPEISITKLARNNPLGFKIKTAVLPEINLPAYKEIAKKVIGDVADAEKDLTVTDADVENTIMDIRKSRAPKVKMPEAHEHKKNEAPNPDPLLVKKRENEELPEFNDDFVQALGPFKNVEDFKEKLKVNIKLEKENALKEKTRLKIIEKIIDGSVLEIPEILVDIELDKILFRMKSDITQMGLKFEDYLKHLNKTTEDLKKDFRVDAEKKAKLALILNEIAKVENITADEEQVAKEVAVILDQYKDADPDRAQIHAENVLTNEKIFQFLESQ